MTSSLNLNLHIQIETITTPKERNPFTSFLMFAALACLPAATAFAQIDHATIAATPLIAIASPSAIAQIAANAPLQLPTGISGKDENSSSSVDVALPEDPSAQTETHQIKNAQDSNQLGSPTAGPVAPIHMKYIPAGWTAQPITAHDKFLIGLHDLYSPLDFAAMIASAGYEQVLNGEPNYGTDRGAFGERLGAAGIRETTQGFFTDSVFSPLLHEDPRYYVEGSQHGFFHRTVYAVTRPLITRTDSGHSTINGALLLGYAASSALTYTYYPSINQNFRDTTATFGGAIGGAAVGYFVSEFSGSVLQALHLEKKP